MIKPIARAFLVSAALLAAPGSARAEEPETKELLFAGAAMAVPTYFVGVAAHEGSHALAATMSGARVKTLHLLPGWRRGKFYFGYVEVDRLRCDRQRVSFLIAPKVTDAILLGGYAALQLGGSLPANEYGALALTVLATGFWVDFTKDVIAFWDHNDLVKVYRMAGAEREIDRLPYRLLHAGLAAAGAVAIVRGYREIFDAENDGGDAAARVAAIPLWTGRF